MYAVCYVCVRCFYGVMVWCRGVAVFLGAMYMLAMVMSLKCFVCIFRSCVVLVDGLWRLDVRECCV